MPRRRSAFFFLITLLMALTGAFATVAPASPDSTTVDFSSRAAVLELKSALVPYHAASTLAPDGSHWHIMIVANQSPRPVTRIFLAEESPDAAIKVLPRHARPAIRQIASSDPDVVAEPAQAYGRHAFRVTVPPSSTVSLALMLSDADARPPVAAWSEGALAAHNRQLAVFFAAVAGLIAAALAITLGLAVMTGHPAPRWAGFTLLAVFLSRLAASGLFDSIGATDIGGPYGLSAMLAGLSLAAGLRFADTVAPIEALWRNGARLKILLPLAVTALSLLSFVGVPGAMLVTEIVVGIGAAVVAVYLVTCGRLGAQAARVAAPAAVVFALVVAVGAISAFGGFAASPAAPGVVGGFAAAGAVLLALAVAAGEGIAILPARRLPAEPADKETSADNANADIDPALLAIGASHQGLFDFDLVEGRVRISSDGASLIGLQSEEVSFTTDEWVACIHPDDREIYSSAMEEFRKQPGLAFRMEFRVEGASGENPWMELRATMLGDEQGSKRCLGLIADVTARKQTEANPQPDGLLGTLPGKAELFESLRSAGLTTIVLALVDIDRFKSVHASLGDAGGDAVLNECARRLSLQFAGAAHLYRVGGDGFALVFEKTSDPEAAASKAVDALKPAIQWGDREVYVTASAGVAAGLDAESPEELLKHAGLALAEAKRQGGGSWRRYVIELARSEQVDSVALEADLKRAIANGDMDVVFQPIMRLKTGTVAGFEALLRWAHPAKGAIEPADFIAHSEQTGSILELGRFALEQAMIELARWQKHFPLDPPLIASVNLSKRQLQDGEFESTLSRFLSSGSIAPATLKLELTETAVGNVDDAAARLARLKAMGAGLAIDDFGTGLSALSQLKDLPFDTLKIDKSFLARSIDGSGDGASILRSIVNLAHELKMTVVAEGVETARDAHWLREIGCEFAQGYYFSPPLPRGDALAFIARHHGADEAQTLSGVAGVGGESGDVDTQTA